MDAGSTAAGRGPRRDLVRHGLVLGALLTAGALAGSLLPGDGEPGQPGAAPYGVPGCSTGEGAGPVDVLVRARPLSAGGSPAPALGGAAGGPGVGASVRNLAGYEARGLAPCDVVHVRLHLQDPAGGSVTGTLAAAPAPVTAVDGADGELVAVDWTTWESSLPAHARAGDLEDQTAWFVTLLDPAPGTYRLVGRVSAGTPEVAGDVEVLLDVVPAG
ncbi:hypothetical protein [Kineococcus terrestris]|uniref:hypothetical protein n=1 Tax=Kineococcus terrestris TaxID=2044856 RepID=UPI0034DABBF1